MPNAIVIEIRRTGGIWARRAIVDLRDPRLDLNRVLTERWPCCGSGTKGNPVIAAGGIRSLAHIRRMHRGARPSAGHTVRGDRRE